MDRASWFWWLIQLAGKAAVVVIPFVMIAQALVQEDPVELIVGIAFLVALSWVLFAVKEMRFVSWDSESGSMRLAGILDGIDLLATDVRRMRIVYGAGSGRSRVLLSLSQPGRWGARYYDTFVPTNALQDLTQRLDQRTAIPGSPGADTRSSDFDWDR